MKTQEEIEQLASEHILSENGQIGFVLGYIQCKKDVADKKYTEEDMMLIRNKLVSILPTGDNISAWDMLQAVSKYIKWFDDYIN